MPWTTLVVSSVLLIGQTTVQQTPFDSSRPSMPPSGRRAAPATPVDEETSGAATTPRSAAPSIYGTQAPGADRYQRAAPKEASPPFGTPPAAEYRTDPAASPSAAAMTPVGPTRQKLRPPEILAEALAEVKEDGISGKPLTLAEVLERVPDRQQQIAATKSYWRLATARADFHFARDAYDRLLGITGDQQNLPGVQAALAAQRAARRDAELALTRAQYELAEQISLLSSDALPLPVDRPHVGEYRTWFDKIFAGRPAPPAARLVNATIPLRRQAIDAHGAAVLAAVDALDATGDDYQRGAADLAAVLTCLEQLSHQRRAFVAAVRDYNYDIGDYAFMMAPEGISTTKLVGMLIKTEATPTAPATGTDSLYERPNTRPTVETPVGPTASPADQTFREPPPAIDPRASGGAPTNSVLTQPPADPRYSTPASPAAPPATRTVPRTHEGRKQIAAEPGAGVYQGLMTVTSNLRTQKLSGLLHWDRSLPEDRGQNISLAECLQRQSVSPQRRRLIDVYWKTREHAARYQAWVDQSEALATLAPLALAVRDDPGGMRTMLRLQSLRASAKAALLDEHVALTFNEFRLTSLVGAPLENTWLLPSTTPHAGRYRLALQQLSPAISGQIRVQRLAAAIPLLHDEMEELAASIVQADSARAAATADGQPRPSSIQNAMLATQQQNAATMTFLKTVTAYNLAIADYALAVMGPGVPSQRLVEVLVVKHDEPAAG